jgi:hypothetical protein
MVEFLCSHDHTGKTTRKGSDESDWPEVGLSGVKVVCDEAHAEGKFVFIHDLLGKVADYFQNCETVINLAKY